jgi:hypothetical protein
MSSLLLQFQKTTGSLSRNAGSSISEFPVDAYLQMMAFQKASKPIRRPRYVESARGGLKNRSPFNLANGQPYLEVHHVKPLAEGGPDLVENAVALCPNCHRRCHLSVDRDAANLYLHVSRLIRA